jgi:hypothetical protein
MAVSVPVLPQYRRHSLISTQQNVGALLVPLPFFVPQVAVDASGAVLGCIDIRLPESCTKMRTIGEHPVFVVVVSTAVAGPYFHAVNASFGTKEWLGVSQQLCT